MVQVTALILGLVTAGPVVESRRIGSALLPFERVHGVARSGSSWLVGGLRGLSIGQPGGPWREVSKQAVKTMVTAGEATWVLYGNGAVDKVELRTDRLFYDVLQDASKRPWVSSISHSGGMMLFGGQGGWVEKSAAVLQESYPGELNGRPVMAIARTGPTLWLGTQDGLFRRQGSRVDRFGFGAGLSDIWITALLPSKDSILVGLASGGLARFRFGKAVKIPTPSQRVRALANWHGHTVLGALEGAWLQDGSKWIRLIDVEATFLGELDDELIVGTPSGLRFFKWAQR